MVKFRVVDKHQEVWPGVFGDDVVVPARRWPVPVTILDRCFVSLGTWVGL